MKRILSLVAIGLTLFVLACKTADEDPQAAAKKFFEAIQSMDMNEAEKYATKESKSMLDLMKMGMNFSDQSTDSLKREMQKQKMVYSEPVITGDTAVMNVTVNDAEKTELVLVKQDGKWKVAFDKNTLMKSGLDRMEQQGMSQEEIEEAEKAMKMLNKDSFQNAVEQALKEGKPLPDSVQ